MPVNLDWVSQIAQPVKPVDPLQMQMQAIALQNAQLQQQEMLQNIDKAKRAQQTAEAWQQDVIKVRDAMKSMLDKNGTLSAQAQTQLLSLVSPQSQMAMQDFFTQFNKDQIALAKETADIASKSVDTATKLNQLKQIKLVNMASGLLPINDTDLPAAFKAAFGHAQEEMGWSDQDAVNALASMTDQNGQITAPGIRAALETIVARDPQMATAITSQTTKRVEAKKETTRQNVAEIYSGIVGGTINQSNWAQQSQKLIDAGVNPASIPTKMPSAEWVLSLGMTPEEILQGADRAKNRKLETDRIEIERQRNRINDIQRDDQRRQSSYQWESGQIENLEKGLRSQYDNIQQALSDLVGGKADGVIAPAILKAMVAGQGVRITNPEINGLLGTRNALGDIEVLLNRVVGDKNFKLSADQRTQLGEVLQDALKRASGKLSQTIAARKSLSNPDIPIAEQRKIVDGLRESMYRTPASAAEQLFGRPGGNQ
jgi:hypothetical protein